MNERRCQNGARVLDSAKSCEISIILHLCAFANGKCSLTEGVFPASSPPYSPAVTQKGRFVVQSSEFDHVPITFVESMPHPAEA